MASSSTMSRNPQQKYQVFLSFRGEDTRHNFTSHLYEALCEKGVATFIDNEIERGEEISPSLLSAIQGSMMSVIIFSKTYPSSRWCLQELEEIIKCKKLHRQIVIPVFYHVDPSHVRKQNGTFKNPFAELEKRFDREIVERWRSILAEAGNLSGWTLDGKTSEAQYVKEIVNDVLKRLRSAIPLSNYKELVGIESKIKGIEELLLKRDVCSVGIWGPGGIGKTTIARVMFNEICCNFHRFHFIENVRQKDTSGLICLREEILLDILGDKHANLQSPIIQQRLGLMKILIVFDDVTSLKQIEDLFGDLKSMSSESRILITSRDKQVLKNCEVNAIYEVDGLSHQDGLHLFRIHAFRGKNMENIPKDYKELSDKLVCYVKGFPLAIKVLGCLVQDKSEAFWTREISKLEETLNLDIYMVLKVSYDGLDREEQAIFLDIACFFKGMNRKLITNILDACDLYTECGIERLIDKCLITISFDGSIMMHDLLEDMGKEIVMEEKKLDKRSHLWDSKHINNALTKNKGSYKTRGIWLDLSKKKVILKLKPSSFSKMDNLMFLKVYTGFNSQVNNFSDVESDFTELRYLHWPGYPCKSLPLNFQPENLVSLEMPNSNLEQLWTGVQNLGLLKYVDLENSRHLLKIPDLSQAPNLETLNLNECKSLIEISLPSTQELKLVNLNLRNCKSLNNLPPGIQSKSLVLSGCANLTVAPKISSDMVCLCLDGTGIGEFPTTSEYPSAITRLNLENCSRLEKLPFGIYKWESLRRLTLSYCSNLNTIPKLPPKLEELYLDGTGIEELTSSIEHLSHLTRLSLKGCSRLNCLPSDISNLKSLRYLRLFDCSNLKMLPKFQDCRIRELYLNRTAIEQLPSSFVENLSDLRKLDVQECVSLESLPEEICRLKSLEELNLSGCSKLDRLPDDLGNLEALLTLRAEGLAIKEVPSSIVRLKKLTHLSFSGCKSLELLGLSLPSLSGFFRFKRLDLADCGIMELPNSLGNLYSLCYLNLSKNNFGTIPTGIIHLSKLNKLVINYCNRLQCLPTLPCGLIELEAKSCMLLRAPSDLRIPNVSFFNCFNLDLNSAAFATSLVDIDESTAYRRGHVPTIIRFPGREIPEWFNCQVSGCSIELPRDYEFEGFAFCVVLSFQNYVHKKGSTLDLCFRLDVKNEDGEYERFDMYRVTILSRDEAICIESDHVLMGCIKRYQIYGLPRFHVSEAIINFEVGEDSEDPKKWEYKYRFKPVEVCRVKKAGVHLLFNRNQASRLGIRNNGGESVEVQRGHIERFTGRDGVQIFLSTGETHLTKWQISNPFEAESSSRVQEFLSNHTSLQALPHLPFKRKRKELRDIVKNALPNTQQNRNVWLEVEEMTSEIPKGCMCFTGSEIPGWFGIQNSGGCIIELQQGSFNQNFVGLAFCAIVNFKRHFLLGNKYFLNCELRLRCEDGDSKVVAFGSIQGSIEADTCFNNLDKTFLGYDCVMYSHEFHELSCDSEASINFFFTPHGKWFEDIEHSFEFMKCGVRFLCKEDVGGLEFDRHEEESRSSLLQSCWGSTTCGDQQASTNFLSDVNKAPQDFVELAGDVIATPRQSFGDYNKVDPSGRGYYDDDDEPQSKRLKAIEFLYKFILCLCSRVT